MPPSLMFSSTNLRAVTRTIASVALRASVGIARSWSHGASISMTAGVQGRRAAHTGPPCHRCREFVDHGDGCVRCNPCPHLTEAIEVVVGWREARILRSRAEALRIKQTIAAATRRVA